MLRIVIADSAAADLQAIYNQRLAQRGRDGTDGADALLDSLYGAMEGLAHFPLRGPVPIELDVLGIKDWRQLSLPPFRVIYTVDSDAVTVAIIADGRRDFSLLLEQRLLRASPNHN